MPAMTDLVNEFRRFGYEVPTTDAEHQYFTARGGRLGELSVWVRWREEFCSVGLLIGIMEAVPVKHRYSLLVDMLELNFEHPLGRLCLARAGTSEKEAGTQVILAETSFFFHALTQTKLDGRMDALAALALAASKLLAVRGAITDSNPFYEQLKAVIPIPTDQPPSAR